MGFYGNVYYQLINSFYKLVGNNNGKNVKNYSGNNAISADKLKSDIATEAVGRKGVINLDTGNYWIGITEGDKVDGLEIVHMPPTTSNTTLVKGIEYLGTEKPATVTAEMEAGGYIKTHEIKYDSAGHVASKAEKIYKLPKPEVADRIAALEELVGVKADGASYPKATKETLHGYVADNFSNVTMLKEYVGDWTKICDTTSYRPTIQATIGDLDELFSTKYDGLTGSYSGNRANWHGLTGVIGPINELWHAYDTSKNTPISLVEVLLKQKDAHQNTANQVTENHDNVKNQFNGMAAIIGTQLDNNKSAFEEIAALQNILKWPADSTTTVSAELTRLEKKINDDNAAQTTKITNAYTAKTNEITGTLNNAVSTLNTTIDDKDKAVRKDYSDADAVLKAGYEAADATLKTNYEAADAALKTGYENADATLKTNYEAADTALSNRINTLTSNTDNKFSSIDEKISSLEEKDDSLTEDINKAKEDLTNAYKAADTALKEELTAVDNNILSILDWSEDTDKTVSGEIANIVNTLGWDGETETVKNKIAAVQDSLTGFMEASTTLHTALTTADTDLSTRITALDGAYKAADKALEERITPLETDNNKLFTILGVNKEEDYTEENLVSRLSTAEAQLETTKTQLEEILGVDISKAETNEDGSIKVNILDRIFNSIEEMKGNISQISSDITLIKEKMNELHSDNPPFSDDSNTGEEEI